MEDTHDAHETIETIRHDYWFDVRKPEDKAAYDALAAKLTGEGLKCFETWGGGSHYNAKLDGKTLQLETRFLFADQWNTAPIEGISDKGLRVHDWAQDYPVDFSSSIKRGHWLRQTDRMRAIRRETRVCGYCGKNYPSGTARGESFCTACIGSEYLKETELHLLRLLPVAMHLPKRAPLTDAERALLLPLYTAQQTKGNDARAVARAKRVREQNASKFATAKLEHDGTLWLLDHGVNTENCIFYSHRRVFTFGWRAPVSAAIRSQLLDILVEFPYEYEIKAEEVKS